MSLGIEICTICLGEKVEAIWIPLDDVLLFVPYNDQKIRWDHVMIGQDCRKKIMMMLMDDPGVFDGCKSLHDICRVVREEPTL